MKAFAIALVAAAILSSPVAAGTSQLDDRQLDHVAAGCGGPCPTLKGNNGWGNGADGTNPGSFAGKTAPSKILGVNGLFTGVNANPTGSTGR